MGTKTSRSINWEVTDVNSDAASNGAKTSTIVTSTINITAVNDAPLVTGTSLLAYTEGETATVISGSISPSDADDTHLDASSDTGVGGAKVSISNSSLVSGDQLGVTLQAGITGDNTGNGVLLLEGPASLAAYQAVLASVTYRSSSDDPTANNTKTKKTKNKKK